MSKIAPSEISLSLFTFIWQFICRQKITFLLIFLVPFVWSLDTTLWPYLLRILIDTLTQYDSQREAVWPALRIIVGAGLCLWVGVEAAFRLQGLLLARAMPKLEADIRMAMFDHVQQHSPKYFNERFSGSLANKITDMTTQVSQIFQQLLTAFIPALVACILAVFFLSRINPLFGVILFAWIFVHFAICMSFTKNCDKYENIHSEARSTLLGKIVDSLTNNFAVNLLYRFLNERAYIGRFQEAETLKNQQSKKYVEMIRFFLGLGIFFGGGLGINGFMLYSWTRGLITTGEVAQVFNTTWNIITFLWIAGAAIPVLFQSIGTARQALILMQDPKDILDLPGALHLRIDSGEIVFENVTFQYGERKLFRNKCIQIRKGEKVGLVGYSGAGKSTFVNLILRFFPPSKGRILIDGQDISKITLESLREQIALIPQDPILFHRSLRENIRCGKSTASEEEILRASRLAHCDEFINKFPNKYDTLVGERGTKLSGGERQRIAIARAILANTPILILDEATSALDSVTETYVQESFESLEAIRTTIVIAHRLSTLGKMDRLLVFSDGEIIEEGSHANLLANQGHYAQMWHMQSKGFLPKTPKSPQDKLMV